MSDIFYMFTKLNQFYQKVDVLLKIMVKIEDDIEGDEIEYKQLLISGTVTT